MEYMSCAEAAGKWGISERRVQKLCEWAISNINKTRIDMAVQWLPTAIIIFFAYMIIFGGVIGTIFKKRDIT